MGNSFFELIITEVSRAVSALTSLPALKADGSVDAGKSSEKVEALLKELGFLPPAQTGDVFQDVATGLAAAVKAIVDIVKKVETDAGKDIIDLAKDIFPILKDAFPAFKKVAADFQNNVFQNCAAEMNNFANVTNFGEAFPRRLLDYLILRYLLGCYPKVYSVLMLAGLAVIVKQEEKADEFKSKCNIMVINWESIPLLIKEPLSIPAAAYSFGGNFNAELFMDNLDFFMRSFALPGGLYPMDGSVVTKLNGTVQNTQDNADKEMRIPVFTGGDWSKGDYWALNLCIAAIRNASDAQKYRGFGAYFSGGVKENIDLNEAWKLGVAADMQKPVMLKFLPEGVQTELLTDDGSSFTGGLSAKITYQPKEPMILLGFSDSLSVGFKGVSLVAAVEKNPNSVDFAVEADIMGLFVQIQAGEGDSFIQKLLPSDPIRVAFDIGFGYSSVKKFYIKMGSDGLGGELLYTWQINKEFWPVFIRDIIFSLKSKDQKILASAAVSAKAELGPVMFMVEKVGLSIVLDTAKPGILGKADMYVNFKLPEAVGIKIDASAVTGGGYLAITDTGYEGILYISVSEQFSITAIGILTTKPPDGGNYYSLKILGNVTFTPIQLGFGIFICGIGIAAAINSQMNVTALQNSVRDGSITSVLFPPDPINNAPRIINDLKTFLPPKEGTHVFGVMVKLGWGGGVKIIEADLGIFIQIGDYFKLAIAGVISVVLPKPESPVVALKFATIGIIDTETKTISIDASLYSSKILTFPISGDMAFRFCYGENSFFAMSAGGFYPGYKVPTGFPELRRLSIAFGSDNPKIMLASYFAITENSVQFGASVDFFFQHDFGGLIGNIKLDGSGGFDALIQFKPKFYFECCLYMRLSLSRNDKKLLFLSMDAHFSGPNVFHLWGGCSVDICGIFSKTFEFNEYFGDEIPEQQSPKISALSLLEAEVKNNTNWIPTASTATETLVAFRYGDDVKQYLDIEGGMSFSQNLMPLEMEIEKLGESDITEGKAYFKIEPVVSGAAAQNIVQIKKNFAPGMYKYLDDSQKLSSPAFQKNTSGFEVSSYNTKAPTSLEEADLDYEIIPVKADLKSGGMGKRSMKNIKNKYSLNIAAANSELNSVMVRDAGHAYRTKGLKNKAAGAYRVNY